MSRLRSSRNEHCLSKGATSRKRWFDAKSVPSSRNSTFLSFIGPIYDLDGSGRDCLSGKRISSQSHRMQFAPMITNAVLTFVSKTAPRQPVSPTRPVPATRPTNMLAVVPSRHPTHRRGRRRAHPPPDPPMRSPFCQPATRPTDEVAVVPTRHPTHRRGRRRSHSPPDPPTWPLSCPPNARPPDLAADVPTCHPTH